MAWSPSYVTVEELAAYVRIGDLDDHDQLGLAVAAASRAIDKACGRQFGQDEDATARLYTARLDPSPGRWVVDIDDLMDETGLLIEVDLAGDGSFAGGVTGLSLRPLNAAADGAPWTRIVFPPSASITGADGAVRVTARWGWLEVPEAVKQACLLQASRLFARRNSPFGIAGSPEAGSEMRLLAKVDPDVEVALRPFKRRTRVVFA